MQLTQSGGDLMGIDHPYYYATKILAYAYPERAAVFLTTLIDAAKAGNWNEADTKVKPKLLLISTLTQNLLGHFTFKDHDFQHKVLANPDYRIRAVAAAPLLFEGSYQPRSSESFADFDLKLRSGLPNDEYRIVLAAVISELWVRNHMPHTQAWLPLACPALIQDWTEDEELVKRILAVLGGRLAFNYSYRASLNFLDPLVAQGFIDNNWCFQVWNAALLDKIKYRDLYVSGSSNAHPYHFAVISDVELTHSVIHYFEKLPASAQQSIFREWCVAIKPMWAVMRQPFSQQINHNAYSGAAERIGWLVVILETLQRHQAIDQTTDQLINDFFQQWQAESKRVRRHEERREQAPLNIMAGDWF